MGDAVMFMTPAPEVACDDRYEFLGPDPLTLAGFAETASAFRMARPGE